MPGKDPRRVAPSLDWNWVALAVLALHGALVVLLPPHPVRLVLSILAALAAGHALLRLLGGASLRLSLPEGLAFTTGLAVLVAGLGALLLPLAGLPFGDHAIPILGIPLALLAIGLRRGAGARPRIPPALAEAWALPGYTRAQRLSARALFAAIVVTTAVLLAMAAVPYPDTRSPALALGGPDGSPDSLPRVLGRGQEASVTVHIFGGDASRDLDLRVRLLPSNVTGNASFHRIPWSTPLRLDALAEAVRTVPVAAGSSSTQVVAFAVEGSGAFVLEVGLLDAGTPVATNLLPLTVAG